MASKHGNEQDQGSSQTKKNLDDWKFPKIPISQVYKKNTFRIFPSYAIKDYEQTLTIKASNQHVITRLLTRDFLKGFIKKQHEFLHLGLVQISIKPLVRNGLGAPIIVCLRDARHLNFENSLLSLVESNLSQGPFYFNCFPSFSVSTDDACSLDVLTLNVKTGGVPLALTYRLVCKAMSNLTTKALKESVLGETVYVQPATGTRNTTRWNTVEVPELWTRKPEQKQRNHAERLPDGRVVFRFPSARQPEDDDE